MVVYIENAIVLNWAIHICFILIISKSLNFKLKKKMLLITFFASIFSILSQNILNKFVLAIYDSCLVLFILSASFKNLTKKHLFQSFIFYILISNAFSGFFLNLLNINNLTTSTIPIYIVLTFMVSFSFIIRKTFDMIISKRKIQDNILEIELFYNNTSIKTLGYYDSGNNLIYNSEPVSIIGFKLFEKLTKISLSDYLSKNYNLKNEKFVEINSLAGSKKLLMFQIEKIKIKNKKNIELINNPNLALSLKLNNSNNYEIILNNNYF